MNTKRQTIWLVSMLSLMVVLSAYYLFTEDVNKLNTQANSTSQENIKVTTEVKDPADVNLEAVDGAVVGEEVSGEAVAEAESGSEQAAAESADAATDASTDEQVLDQIQTTAASGSDFFAAQVMQRNEVHGKLVEELIGVLGSTKASDEEIAKADDQLNQIQTTQAKVESIEDTLAKDYSNAIVLQEGSKYKVVVQTEKLDRKAAQSIIDLVIRELGVKKDYVSVQYMQ